VWSSSASWRSIAELARVTRPALVFEDAHHIPTHALCVLGSVGDPYNRPKFSADPPDCDPYLRVRAKGRKRVRMSPGCWLRNGLELDHLRSGKCDAQHLGSEVHEHCRIAVFGADHGTEAVPIMADSVAHGVARHNSDGWLPVEGTSWEGPPGAGAARCHASSVRPMVCARPRCQSFSPPGRDPNTRAGISCSQTFRRAGAPGKTRRCTTPGRCRICAGCARTAGSCRLRHR
jgi:hypothetical protein